MTAALAADVSVIGAGIAGVTLAAELAARGLSVLVIEAAQICGGSTGLNAGGVRQQFSHPLNIELARRTVSRVTRLQEQGHDIRYRQVGYLFLARTQATASALQSVAALQRSGGVDTQWLSASDAAALVPGMDETDLLGGSFCDTDGHLDPYSWVMVEAAEARRLGVRFLTDCAVTSVRTVGSKVVTLGLANGERVASDVVANCAGAWASTIAGLYGAALPISPWRSQCFVVQGATGVSEDGPMTIDYDNGRTYFHTEAPGALLTGTDADGPCEARWRMAPPADVAEMLGQRLIRLHPGFADAAIHHSWAGLLEVTPDENPIVGWTHLDNVFTVAGFSGHGLPLAPSLSAQVAEILTGGTPDLDLSPYSPERFQDAGASSTETMVMR